MSDALFNEFALAFAEVNSVLTSVFDRDNAQVFLLKREAQSQRFTQLEELTSGYLIEFGQVRDDIILNYSTTEDVSDRWSEMTHIAYGVPDDNNELYVYEIVDDQKDGITPNALSNEFRAFASRLRRERYELAAPTSLALHFDGQAIRFDGTAIHF